MATTVIKRQLASLPTAPGVYQFFDAKDNLLYVGKAKNLRSRVTSYFHQHADLSPAKQIMVQDTHHLQVTTVKNETEALFLESNLIKQHQPPYNIVLKDDKSWLYYAIDYRDPFPRVTLERRPVVRGVKYFGPYPAASIVRNSFQLLKKILGLRTCTNPPDKPCFASKLGRCLGHNLGPGSKTAYQQQLKMLEQILRGHTATLVRDLTQAMQHASAKKQFERAAKLRDQLRAVERLGIKQSIISPRRETYDVFALARTSTQACVARLLVRQGVLLDIERFLLDHTHGATEPDILTAFLQQYYPQVTERPRQTYLPFKPTEPILMGIKFIIPERGKKHSLLQLAQQAAATYLDHSAASWERLEARAARGIKELQELLGLGALPRRIEGYDISNIQGQEAVGSLVVLRNGVPEPSQYRKFKIQGLATPNDFAMLAQVLERRFTKNHDWPRPDLVMLDGGAGQLSVVARALHQAGIQVPLVALAKKEELLYLPQRTTPLRLPADSPALQTLQSLRDEAHRFGITFHRARRAKKSVRSLWDELPGVGPVLKRKLKASFGTPQNLRRTSLAQLTALLGLAHAKNLKDFLDKS